MSEVRTDNRAIDARIGASTTCVQRVVPTSDDEDTLAVSNQIEVRDG